MIGSEQAFSGVLLKWYDEHRRDLPWRVKQSADISTRVDANRINAYHVLVSEFMLQQTQAATVIPYFNRFLEAFPTIQHLAAADSQRVLRLWQGLGYYSRARRLQASAIAIVNDHGGVVPGDLEKLLSLPGVGRYTAGAISSIAFDRHAPILDGNVIRVLTRLDGIRSDPRDPKTLKQLWRRAEEVLPKKRIGDFNSAMMELGATVCTPRSPACLTCPVRKHCKAFALNIMDKIPLRTKAKPTPLIRRWTIGVRNNGRWLVEQRPPTGRWAGMWQFVTIDPGEEKSPTRKFLKNELRLSIGPIQRLGSVQHSLTHRRYHFEVFSCDVGDVSKHQPGENRHWQSLDELRDRPISRPQLIIADMLRNNT